MKKIAGMIICLFLIAGLLHVGYNNNRDMATEENAVEEDSMNNIDTDAIYNPSRKSPMAACLEVDDLSGSLLTLTLTATAFTDAPNTMLNIQVPEEIEIINGDTEYNVDMTDGETVSIQATLKIISAGEYTIIGTASCAKETWTFGDSDVLFITANSNGFQYSREPVLEKDESTNTVSGGLMKASSRTSAATITVNGTFQYTDSDGDKQSVKNAVVKIFDADTGEEIGTGKTDGNGKYSIPNVDNNNGQADIYVKVYADGDGLSVKKGVNDDVYSFQTDTTVDAASGDMGAKECPSDDGAFHIYNTVQTGYDYLIGQGYTPPKTTVKWGTGYLNGGVSHGFSHFTHATGVIHIEGYASDPDEWDNDVILHEYGHYVMNKIYNGKGIPNAGGRHFWDAAANRPGQNPRNLALSEGWATFFQAVAQNNNTYTDTGAGGVVNTEYYVNGTTLQGDDIEGTICNLLWDLHGDFGVDEIMDVLRNFKKDGHYCYNIHDFWDGWFARGHNEYATMTAKFKAHGIEKNFEFQISVSSDKAVYLQGETANMDIDVMNVRNVETEFTLGVSIKQITDAGEHTDIVLTQDAHQTLDENESITFDAQWNIPNDAKVGEYQLAVNCWWDPYNDDHYYKDNINWVSIFIVGDININITTPTKENNASVGAHDNPIKYFTGTATVTEATTGTSLLGLTTNSFMVKVGMKNAVFTAMYTASSSAYKFTIMTPTQDDNGEYDLNISVVQSGNVVKSDTNLDSVYYSEEGGANVTDIVFVFDDTYSMYGQIKNMQDNCIAFADAVAASGLDYRLGLISFKDTINKNMGMTDNASVFQGWVTDLKATGGDDWPENQYGALVVASEWSFREGALVEFVLITDIHSHYAGEEDPDDEFSPQYTQAQVTSALTSKNIVLFAYGPSGSGEGYYGGIISATSGSYLGSRPGDFVGTILPEVVAATGSDIISEKGTINPGDTKIHDVYIDTTMTSATITATIAGSDIGVSLLDPNGKTINENTTDPNITFKSVGNSKMFIINNITDESAGKWELSIYGEDVSYYGEEYSMKVSADTNVILTAGTDKDEYMLGEPVHITATVMTPEKILTDVYILTNVTDTNSITHSIVLYDDGMHSDGYASDGIFANYFTGTGTAGSYKLVTSAAGLTALGEAFTRMKSKTAIVNGTVPTIEVTTAEASYDFVSRRGGMNTTTVTFTSTSDTTMTGLLSVTDLVNSRGATISADNILLDRSALSILAFGSENVTITINVPSTVGPGEYGPGEYTGYLIFTSTQIMKVPIKVDVRGFSVDFSEESITLDIKAGGSTAKTIDIALSGYGGLENMDVTVSGDMKDWVTYNLSSTSIPENSTGTITLTISPPSTLPAGTHNGMIYITSSDTEAKSIPMQVTVAGAEDGGAIDEIIEAVADYTWIIVLIVVIIIIACIAVALAKRKKKTPPGYPPVQTQQMQPPAPPAPPQVQPPQPPTQQQPAQPQPPAPPPQMQPQPSTQQPPVQAQPPAPEPAILEPAPPKIPKFCPYCGVETKGSKFCGNCGAKVT